MCYGVYNIHKIEMCDNNEMEARREAMVLYHWTALKPNVKGVIPFEGGL